MKKSLYPLATALFSLITSHANAAWPDKVFAPYMYIGAGDHFKLTDGTDACGLKYYTLAFIICRQDGYGKDATYHKEPAWDGHTPMEQNLYKDQIDAIRQRGGDVIMSFGGEAGKELANIIDDPAELEAAYQKVINQYQFTWLDFDVEGNNLDHGQRDSERRNSVLASLQKKNPGLIISYTLPVDPDGLSDASLALLKDAVKKGMKVHSANLMVMFFGQKFIHKGKSEGELGVESANKAHEQIQQIDPTIQVGLCPCLGENGSKAEVFTLDDAKTLKAFADATPWVCSVHYWSINDDVPRHHKRHGETNNVPVPDARQAWAFARVFQPFTTAK
jgi:chitinase